MKLVREILFLKELTEISNNVFTTKIYDVLVPEKAEDDLEKFDCIFLVLEHVDFDLK